ncbi:hypothetical protein MHTCC0001_36710 [Flavobacteriaceae bacterium MHTCC 0001]
MAAERGVLLVDLPPSGPPRVHSVPGRWGKPHRTYRLRPEELDGRMGELERFPGYQRLVMRVVGEDVEGVPKRLEAAGERVVDVRPG